MRVVERRRLHLRPHLVAALTIMPFVTVLAVGVFLSEHGIPLAFPTDGTEAATMVVDAAIGATVEPLDRATAENLGIPLANRGLVITSLGGGGAAELLGIKVGDVIERIDGEPVGSVREAAGALEDAHGAISLTLNRQGHYAIVQLPIRPPSNRRELIEEGALR